MASSGVWSRVAIVRRTEVSEDHIDSWSSQIVWRICLTTNGKESLLQQHLHNRVYPLPWSAVDPGKVMVSLLWRWRKYTLPKRRFFLLEPQGVTSQKATSLNMDLFHVSIDKDTVIKRQAIKMGTKELTFHAFLICAVNGYEWSVLHPGPSTPGEMAPSWASFTPRPIYSWCNNSIMRGMGGWGGGESQSNLKPKAREGKFLPHREQKYTSLIESEVTRVSLLDS
jgi:hypothetical protein